MTILILGADARMAFCAEELRKQGHSVRYTNEETFPMLDAYLLPFPCSRDSEHMNTPDNLSFADFAEKLPPCANIFVANPPEGLSSSLEKKACRIFDYGKNECFLWENAGLTAEGALSRLMQEDGESIAGRSIALVGFGRVGKSLARRLNALGATLKVYSKNNLELAEAESLGYQTQKINDDGHLTVTSSIVFYAVSTYLPCRFENSAIVYDLAGFLHDADCLKTGATLHVLRAIPGKYAPKSAGVALARAILEELEEREK